MVLAVILGCHRLSKGRTFSRSIPSLRDCGEHLAGRPWSIVYPIRRINSFLWIARRAGPPSEGMSIGRISWRRVCTTCAMAECSLISARAKFRSPSGSTEQTVISRRAANFRLNLSPRTVWRLLRPAPEGYASGLTEASQRRNLTVAPLAALFRLKSLNHLPEASAAFCLYNRSACRFGPPETRHATICYRFEAASPTVFLPTCGSLS